MTNLNSNAKVITIFSVKGGVSKTNTTVFFSYLLSKKNRVLVIDLCPNGNISLSYQGDRHSNAGHTVFDWLVGNAPFNSVVKQATGEENLFYLPSDDRISDFPAYVEKNVMFDKDLSILKKIEPLKPHFDFIVLDVHPSKSDKNTIMALVAASGSNDKVVVPFRLDGASEEAMEESAKILIHNNFNYHIIPTAVHTRGVDVADAKYLHEVVRPDLESQGITGMTKYHVRYSLMVMRFSRDNRRKVKAGKKMDSFLDFIKHENMRNVVKDYERILIEIGLLSKEVI
jgi:cellulose biosynthesis protein BcsQ